MDWTYLLLATFFASLVQSATGFGFALIAVPFFLIILNSSDAIQVVIIITLITSTVHWVLIRKETPLNLLRWLFVGCILGFPLGVLIYMRLELDTLKMLIAVLIILISIHNGWQMLRNHLAAHSPGSRGIKPAALTAVGLTSGMMASSMAMPGPPLMLYLSTTALDKNQIRAAMFAFFTFSYAGALIMQLIFVGVGRQSWEMSGILTPVAIIGLIVGQLVSKRISEAYFKVLVLIILLMTGSVMLLNL